MLRAVFYARFHPDRGPSIIHQFPSVGSVISAWDTNQNELFNIHDIVNYVIPTYELCERPLSIAVPTSQDHHVGYRVLGFPISIEDSKYDRNRFTFNVCFVLEENQDSRPWDQLVRKTAQFFKGLEVEDGLLGSEEDLPGLIWAGDEGYPAEDVGVVHSILEAIYEDLNLYGEACVRIDDLHVLNLQLAKSTLPLPPKVHGHEVPLLVRELPRASDWTWDLTLQKIVPYVDGTRHVLSIAQEADVELKLVRKTIRELVRNERAMLLDIFHFQACYMTTSDYGWFVNDDEMTDECINYIADEADTNFFGAVTKGVSHEEPLLSKDAIINLYSDLRPGTHLADFCLKHHDNLTRIDVRRFITFGVIKGFLKRLHRYALAQDQSQVASGKRSDIGTSLPKSGEEAAMELDRAWKKAALSSGWATPPSSLPDSSFPRSAGLSKSQTSNEEAKKAQDAKMRKYLDGRCCLDQICVEMRMTEKQVVERLRSGIFGEVMLYWH